jgi:hypothetical protein
MDNQANEIFNKESKYYTPGKKKWRVKNTVSGYQSL